MTIHCEDLGLKWDREKRPTDYSEPYPPEFRTGHPVEQYRIWKGCHIINVWAGVLGQEILPSLTWRIASRDDGYHTLALGMKGRQIETIMDLSWPFTRPRDEATKKLLATKTWDQMRGHNVGFTSVEDRLEMFKDGTISRPRRAS